MSTYSLESALVDLPAVPEPCEKHGRTLKSENSFVCSELDSMNGSLGPDPSREDHTIPAINSKPAKDHTAKASLADRFGPTVRFVPIANPSNWIRELRNGMLATSALTPPDWLLLRSPKLRFNRYEGPAVFHWNRRSLY